MLELCIITIISLQTCKASTVNLLKSNLGIIGGVGAATAVIQVKKLILTIQAIQNVMVLSFFLVFFSDLSSFAGNHTDMYNQR